jgi:MGT family glycosyltransferase
MAAITLFNIPYSGHINPTLPIVQKLVEEGHTITYWTTPDFADKVAATGARVQLYPQHVPFPASAANIFALTAQLAQAATQLHPLLHAALQRAKPDLIITDSSTVWGNYLGVELSIPTVTIFPNLVVDPRLFLSDRRILAKTVYDAATNFPDLLAAWKNSRQYVEAFGPAGATSKDILASQSDCNIVLTSAYFQPFAKTLGKHFYFVGPPHRVITPAGKKIYKGTYPYLLYVSLGTLYNDNIHFFQQCLRAFADNNALKVIMSVGSAISAEQLGPIPRNITVADRVDQIGVLHESDVFITHGGMNSVSEAALTSTPMVVVPQTIEQSMNGARIMQLGAGRYIHNSWVTERALRNNVDTVLFDPNYKAAVNKLKASFEKNNSVEESVRIIEKR